VLVKVVLESIPVYWTSLAWIPKGILGKIHQLSYHFLWAGCEDKKTYGSHLMEKTRNP
jgi:hypothetical protein